MPILSTLMLHVCFEPALMHWRTEVKWRTFLMLRRMLGGNMLSINLLALCMVLCVADSEGRAGNWVSH